VSKLSRLKFKMQPWLLFSLICGVMAVINFYLPITQYLTGLNPAENKSTFPMARSILSLGVFLMGVVGLTVYLASSNSEPMQLDIFDDQNE
jgi:hypothetical protein